MLKTLRLQPSELDRMDFWRAEMLLEIHKEKTEEENKRRKKAEEKENGNAPNMNSMLSQQQSMLKSFSSGGFGKIGK